MDPERLLITLEGYGLGPRLCGILETFWDCEHVVTRHNGFHIPALPSTRNTKQIGLVSLTLLNVVVDNVIRTWLEMIVEDQRLTNDGLGDTVRRCLGVFYANNGMVSSRDPDWLQNTTNILVGLFRRYGLEANVAK